MTVESNILLDIVDLHVSVCGKPVLKGVNLRILKGEVHVLLGPNGSGKSTLLASLMGFSNYTITQGKIFFNGQDMTYKSVDERARAGMGVMFQRPPTVPGVQLKTLLQASSPSVNPSGHVSTTRMSEFLERDVNVGFSGGETKRSELLQVMCQKPDLVLLDEPESGVDLENMVVLGHGCKTLLSRDTNKNRGGLIITHTGHILDYVDSDVGHILINGIIRCSNANPVQLLEQIRSRGYFECRKCSVAEACDDHIIESPCPQLPSPPVQEPRHLEAFAPSETPSSLGALTKTKSGAMMIDLDDDLNAMEEEDPLSDDVISLPKQSQATQSSLSTALLERKALEDDGIKTSGRYLQVDQRVDVVKSTVEGLEIIPLKEALALYPEIREKYYWKTVSRDKDEYTKAVSDHELANDCKGYVIICRKGVKLENPVDAGVLMEGSQHQFVHNILIAEPESVLHVASSCTGCSGGSAVVTHYGVSEFFVEENATISFSMVHTFCPKYTIYPSFSQHSNVHRSAAIVQKGGTYLSNYICVHPLVKIQMYPVAKLVGEGATAKFSSVILAAEGSLFDTGSRVILDSPNTTCEMISRIISTGGKVIARAHIQGNEDQTKGHIECQGLVLGRGIIHAIPEIEGCVEGSELSHEAAVGKIAKEKLEYLMSRGLSEGEAISMVVRGFLEIRIKGIPPSLQNTIDRVIDEAAKGF